MSFVGEENIVTPRDLVTYKNQQGGDVFGGGFNVNSVLLNLGIPPMMTLNKANGIETEKVSDIFSNLAIPNWAIAYKSLKGEYTNQYGGSIASHYKNDDDEDHVNDDLYNTLLTYASVDEDEIKKGGKKKSRKLINKKSKKNKTKKH
jgi:hypothetical protein